MGLKKEFLWHVSICPFCGQPVRGGEWLAGSHLCKGLEEALKNLGEMLK